MHRGNAGGMRIPRRGKSNRLAIDQDFAFVSLMKTGHDLDHGGFASAVFAHQGMDLAGAYVETDLCDDLDTCKGLGHSTQGDRQGMRVRCAIRPLNVLAVHAPSTPVASLPTADTGAGFSDPPVVVFV